MKSSTTKMLQDWNSKLGADQMPDVIKYHVDLNANKGYDGAKIITQNVEDELYNRYFWDGLDEFFGSTSHMVVVQSTSSRSGNWESAWHATGWKLDYNGYSVIYASQSVPSYTYTDDDCRSGNVEAMSGCIFGMHGAPNYGFQA